jgi:hypothetical protein
MRKTAWRQLAAVMAALLPLLLVTSCESSGRTSDGAVKLTASERPSTDDAVAALKRHYTELYADDPSYNLKPSTEWYVDVDQVELLEPTGYKSRWSNDQTYPVRAQVTITGVEGTTGQQFHNSQRGLNNDTVFLLYHDSRKGATEEWSVEEHLDDGSIVPN